MFICTRALRQKKMSSRSMGATLITHRDERVGDLGETVPADQLEQLFRNRRRVLQTGQMSASRAATRAATESA